MTALREGSTGSAVKILQATLLAAGFDPQGDDGVFGPDTVAAVERFQTAHQLPVDGVVGPATAAALDLVSGAEPTPTATLTDVPDDAVAIGEQFEGFSATPYQDPVGVWTIGFGSTRDFNGNPITPTTAAITRIQATGLMRRDLTSAATEITRDVRVPLTETERASLEDFIYNVGEGAFRGSTLLRKLNAGDLAGAADEFLKWDEAGGRVIAGLLRRRQAERVEFLKS